MPFVFDSAGKLQRGHDGRQVYANVGEVEEPQVRLGVDLRDTETKHDKKQERPYRDQVIVILYAFVPAIFVDGANIEVMVITHPDEVLEIVPASQETIRHFFIVDNFNIVFF